MGKVSGSGRTCVGAGANGLRWVKCLTQKRCYQNSEQVWEARRGCFVAAYKYRKNTSTAFPEKVYSSDVCVPISNLALCVSETERDFESAGFACIICAHIADGNFHCNIPYATEEEKRAMKDLEHRLIERAIALQGTVSGEHGVGVGKVKHLEKEHGRAHIVAQKRIKRALDPTNMMNPGKFYPQDTPVPEQSQPLRAML